MSLSYSTLVLAFLGSVVLLQTCHVTASLDSDDDVMEREREGRRPTHAEFQRFLAQMANANDIVGENENEYGTNKNDDESLSLNSPLLGDSELSQDMESDEDNLKSKRPHMFVGKRNPDDDFDRNARRMFVGKRSRMFIGKKAPFFIGKRADDLDEYKRDHMFVGKRGERMFIGKRDYEDGSDKRARMFVGKRPHMFVGKRDNDFNDEVYPEKKSRMFVGKRFDELNEEYDWPESDKRARMFVGKRPHMFVGKRDSFDDLMKRARMFVGKRDYLDELDKRAHMFVGKRDYLDDVMYKRPHMFVGKRSVRPLENQIKTVIAQDSSAGQQSLSLSKDSISSAASGDRVRSRRAVSESNVRSYA